MSAHDHVADLLPAFVNGTLDADARTMVQRHLAVCGDCMTSMAAWRAIANAAVTGVESNERAVAAHRPFALPQLAITNISRRQEKTMHASAIHPGRAVPMPLQPRTPRSVRGLLPRMMHIAAAIAILLTIGVGTSALMNLGGGGFNGGAPLHQTSDCSVQPLTDAQIAAAVYIPGAIDGTERDQARYVDPAVAFDVPSTLPTDSPVAQGDADKIQALWDQYQACLAAGGNQSLAFMSDDGLKRIYYRYVINNVSATYSDRAAADPKVNRDCSECADPNASPEATKPVATDANAGQYLLPHATGWVIRDLGTLADGRIVAGLDNPACTACRPEEYEGAVVFVKVGDEWKIDDIEFFYG